MPFNKLSGRFRREAPPPPKPAAEAPPEPPPVPEWTTEEWKHRVEAEARKRMKSEIRGVSSRR